MFARFDPGNFYCTLQFNVFCQEYGAILTDTLVMYLGMFVHILCLAGACQTGTNAAGHFLFQG